MLPVISNLFRDPPPEFVFEITEAGIAVARPGEGIAPAFHPVEAGTLVVSPLTDNVLRPDVFAEQIRTIVGSSGGRRRRPAVLLLPDFCARVAVLRFDSFPSDTDEQASLVRFRMKKSVPFEVESAAVGYYPIAAASGNKAVDVVVVAASLDIIAKYEAPFRSAGLHPGFVTTSAMAMLDLVSAPGITVVARLTGRLLTVTVTSGSALKLLRCVEIASASHDELLGVLFPTIAYVEDELESKPARLLLCGFGEAQPDQSWEVELDVPVERLQSRLGAPSGYNAGLIGYLESLQGSGRKAA